MREQLIARAIEEDSTGMAVTLMAGVTGQQMVDLVWALHDPLEAHQADPCFIAAVVAQAVMMLVEGGKQLEVQQFQTALMDALVNNPGFEI